MKKLKKDVKKAKNIAEVMKAVKKFESRKATEDLKAETDYKNSGIID